MYVRDTCVRLLALCTGMRRGEILGLQWKKSSWAS
jgi:integrase